MKLFSLINKRKSKVTLAPSDNPLEDLKFQIRSLVFNATSMEDFI